MHKYLTPQPSGRETTICSLVQVHGWGRFAFVGFAPVKKSWPCRAALLSMANQEHAGSGAGPLPGVPLGRDGVRHILRKPFRMEFPFRGAPLAETIGAPQFNAGSGRVDLVLVKHTPWPGSGKTSGVYKGGRPVSFMSIPPASLKIAGPGKGAGGARCDCSTIEGFLEALLRFEFRDMYRTKRSCNGTRIPTHYTCVRA